VDAAEVKREVKERLDIRVHHRRNDALFDVWSLVHLATGILGGWLVDPFVALLAMVLWEPLEILVLSPFLGRRGILFGHESLRNSLSDIFFDGLGVAIGFWGLTMLWEPPFHWF
jgi:hypothetical protein